MVANMGVPCLRMVWWCATLLSRQHTRQSRVMPFLTSCTLAVAYTVLPQNLLLEGCVHPFQYPQGDCGILQGGTKQGCPSLESMIRGMLVRPKCQLSLCGLDLSDEA